MQAFQSYLLSQINKGEDWYLECQLFLSYFSNRPISLTLFNWRLYSAKYLQIPNQALLYHVVSDQNESSTESNDWKVVNETFLSSVLPKF